MLTVDVFELPDELLQLIRVDVRIDDLGTGRPPKPGPRSRLLESLEG